MNKLISKFFCFLGIHRWEYGPGYCCSQCGQADDFWKGAQPGRKTKNKKTGEIVYFPPNWILDENYTYID